jgi:hypothetical protein
MADTETKPAEVANPPSAEVPRDKANDSDVKMGEEPVNEPATEEGKTPGEAATEEKPFGEPTTGENPAKESTAEENGIKENGAESTSTEYDGKPSIFNPPPGMLRVSGPRATQKFVKSDPASLEETDDPREIRKQVGFSTLPSPPLVLTLVSRLNSISVTAISPKISSYGKRSAAKRTNQFLLASSAASPACAASNHTRPW